jgi:hypothetical protein
MSLGHIPILLSVNSSAVWKDTTATQNAQEYHPVLASESQPVRLSASVRPSRYPQESSSHKANVDAGDNFWRGIRRQS